MHLRKISFQALSASRRPNARSSNGSSSSSNSRVPLQQLVQLAAVRAASGQWARPVNITLAAQPRHRTALLPLRAVTDDNRPQLPAATPTSNLQQQQQQQQEQQQQQQQEAGMPPRKERDLVIPIAVAISLAAYALVALLGLIDSLSY
ncbi:hypothetical protein OEZ86_009050 [Tetradesmus obliquus]|nr:hypothetical protein OEZ86_009050 [Tetradesmus obliquus]